MSYREYILDDGTYLLIETFDNELPGGIVQASRSSEKTLEKKITGAIDFEKAFIGVKRSIAALQKAFEEAKADEVEVKFGLKAIGEIGNFAVAKTGVEANYEVTLKWIKKDKRKTRSKRRLPA